ncbi:MAG: polyprenyl synthetase family protein [Thermoguttaceae bacterium]|jgi:geranylgeranyl pyrophosphate synthase
MVPGPRDDGQRLLGDDRDSSRLKEVPPSKALREQIRGRAVETAAGLDHARPPCRQELETSARQVLAGLGLSEVYLGWTMVALASAFWREQVAAVPHARRLVLLPRCLRNVEVCRAQVSPEGLECRDCGGCPLTDLRGEAVRQGYRVLVAEGSPGVLKTILSGQVDAVLGVACLDALEKTFDKILLAGIPCMAVPLLKSGCRDTSADLDWIRQMVDTPCRSAEWQTQTYLHLMRAAAGMFEPAELDRLVLARGKGDGPEAGTLGPLAAAEATARQQATDNGQLTTDLPPLGATEAIARGFLASGGKHSRPFITLAVYDALTGSRGTLPDGAEHVAGFSDAVKRVALAIEVFHKASLVHDDIEDDDWFRYGRPALHRRFGPAVAINVGDYLVGLGYRLVASQQAALGAEATADILAQFARAHTKLCEGQGAELMWRDARDRQLSPLDALKICALKTAPAFEAALLAGARLAGPVEPFREAICRFARHLGVAYQVLNDLDDWEPSEVSRRRSGADLLGGRPTVLWALALAGLGETDRAELVALLARPAADEATLARAGELYRRAGAFRQAAALVAKHHRRAGEAADAIPAALGRLFHFLADAILDRRPLSISEE